MFKSIMNLINGKKKDKIETPTVPTSTETVLPEYVIYGKYSPVDWISHDDGLCDTISHSSGNTILKEIVSAVRYNQDDISYPNYLRKCYFSIINENNAIEKIISFIWDRHILVSNIKVKENTVDGYLNTLTAMRYMIDANANGVDYDEYQLVNSLCKKVVNSNRNLSVSDTMMERYKEYLKYVDYRDNIIALGITPINPGVLDNFESVEDMNELIITIAAREYCLDSVFGKDIDIEYLYKFKSCDIVSLDVSYSTLLKIRDRWKESEDNTISIDNIVRFVCSLL